jgi:TadE-like protein
MLEFTVVGSVLLLLGLALVQYGLLFFAKNQMNHATLMAARAASMEHASLGHAKAAYIKTMVPVYGGGRNGTELAESLVRAKEDIGIHATFELLNPTKESFNDFNDPTLQATVGRGRGPDGRNARVIPQSHQYLHAGDVKPASGQNIEDANLLKIRITQGYEPKLPLMKPLFGERIPITTVATMQMQSDAIEPDSFVLAPQPGSSVPSDSGDLPPWPDDGPGDGGNTPGNGDTPTPGEPPCF